MFMLVYVIQRKNKYFYFAEYIISINSKIFRWPKHLEQILELAASKISHKLEIVENNLQVKRTNFNSTYVTKSPLLFFF